MVKRRFKVYASASKESLKQQWKDSNFIRRADVVKQYMKTYKGTKIFEDFAAFVGEDEDDIAEYLGDLESRALIKIPQRMQVDSDFAIDPEDYDEYMDDDDEE